MPDEPLGEQEPRFASAPPFVETSGQEAVELAASAGLMLDPWQAAVLRVMLGERPDGQWACFELGLLVARQNGKGAILEARELAGLFLLGERLILHSAHEFKTSSEAFLRIMSLIENTPDMRRLVRKVRTSHGDEGIELKSGARLRFVARSRSSGRGFSGNCIILDEAQELPRSAMGALMPTLSAQQNPQIIYTGTVPGPDNDAEHWQSVRDRGRAGGDPQLAWFEWSPVAGDDADLDDPAVWALANPALGYRINEETVSRERNSLGDEEFARERLSIWTARTSRAIIPSATWVALADTTSTVTDPVCFAVDVTPDRLHASVAIAGARADGLAHVEVVDNLRGTDWVVDRLAELVGKWGGRVLLDAAGPAGSLIADLERAKVDVTVTSMREMGQACGAFYDAVTQERLRHIDQPALNSAVGAARKRLLGDAWAWARKDATDISPLVAVTLALFGHQAAPPPPKRTGKVW